MWKWAKTVLKYGIRFTAEKMGQERVKSSFEGDGWAEFTIPEVTRT